MSSDSTGSTNPIKGPKVNAQTGFRSFAGTTSTSGMRSFRRYLGESYDGDRQLYDVLGYEVNLNPGHFVAKYKRGPGIASGLVDKPVHDCWAGSIEITESEATQDGETEFEKEVRKFLNGDYTRLKPVSRFRAADRWARLLEYSLIFIGVNDENVTEGDADSLSKPVDESSIDGMDDIQYLAVYDQRRVNWSETKKVDDPTDPRYRLPETYNVEVSSDDTADIHHSRIIHVVEEPDENELKSPSIYESIYNRLEDLQKLYGGSAEMFWRAAYPGLVLTPPTDSDGVPMRFDDGADSVADEIDEYRHNINRLMRVTGNIEKLSTDVASPMDQIAVQIEDISAHIDMPISIIRGNETGERATSEDRAMYHEFVGGRQTEHCEEQVLRAVLDRLLSWGVLPSTVSGDESTNSYDVEWPTQEEPTEQELAEIASTWADAFETAAGGNPIRIASEAEIRQRVLDMDPEYGSEAPDVADPEELAAENLEVPEDELDDGSEGEETEGSENEDDEDPEGEQ